MYTSLLTTLAALTTVSLALPTDSSLAARSCTPNFPSGVSQISLSKTAGQPSTSQTLAFTVPPGAPGPCSLIATFPANFPITSTGNPQVNVIDVNGPAAGAIVGTVVFSSEPWGQKTTTINSFACRPDMQFRLVLAGEEGSVSFAEGNGAGVALTYGC